MLLSGLQPEDWANNPVTSLANFPAGNQFELHFFRFQISIQSGICVKFPTQASQNGNKG